MLKCLNYQITFPTSYYFLLRFINAGHADRTIANLSSFILDKTLLSYNLLEFRPSELAAAAVYIARKAVGRNGWSPTLQKYSKYCEEDVITVAHSVMKAKKALPPGLRSLEKKYSRRECNKVAQIALPSNFEE